MDDKEITLADYLNNIVKDQKIEVNGVEIDIIPNSLELKVDKSSEPIGHYFTRNQFYKMHEAFIKEGGLSRQEIIYGFFEFMLDHHYQHAKDQKSGKGYHPLIDAEIKDAYEQYIRILPLI